MRNPVRNKTYYGRNSLSSVVVDSVQGRVVLVKYPGLHTCVEVPLGMFFKLYKETP
jgi:hypothetical protein